MRAIVYRNPVTKRRRICACLQQITALFLRDDCDDWMPCHPRRRRWRQ